jgi:hypothetical protein
MAEHNPNFIAHIRTTNTSIDQKVKGLCEISLQLQEYSRQLRQKSDEINQRLQTCMNLKRAA